MEAIKPKCKPKVKRSRQKRRLSYKEHRENAQVPRAEEGRDKLRKATEKSKYLATRRYPNEETHIVKINYVFICK